MNEPYEADTDTYITQEDAAESIPVDCLYIRAYVSSERTEPWPVEEFKEWWMRQ